MKKALVLAAVLGVALAACKTMEPRPQPPGGGDCAAPGGSVPPAPPAQTIPDTGTLPSVPQSTELVVGYCPANGRYQAMGVNTKRASSRSPGGVGGRRSRWRSRGSTRRGCR